MTSTTPRRDGRGVTSVALRLRDRLQGDDPDAGFAMMFTLLLIFIVAALSIAVAGIVYNQVKPTQQQRKTVATVDAAYAGIQVALGQIRSANIAGAGRLTSLRCTGPSAATFVANGVAALSTAGATFTGTVNTTSGNTASAGSSSYDVSVAYYTSDPTGQPVLWLQANAMACPLAKVPEFAYLQSHGQINGQATTSGDRTEHATYQFSTTNSNVAGGRIFNNARTLCWDVGSNPGVGTAVTWQPCLALGATSQSWNYRQDLTVTWVGASNTANLCLDYRGYNINSAIASSAVRPAVQMTLQKCVNATPTITGSSFPYQPNQQTQELATNTGWSGVTAIGERSYGDCVGAANGGSENTAGSPLYMEYGNCTGVTADSQVGSGGASGVTTGLPGLTKELVNYAFFGQCLDVTGSAIGNGLILYPCHQAPDPTLVEGNQQFTFTGTPPGSGTITTVRPANPGGGVYPLSCVISPAAPGVNANTGSCDGSTGQQWTFTGSITGDYADSYNIRDASGRCLTATAANAAGPVTLAACTGGTNQKWNAPAATPNSQLANVGEDNGTANNTTP
jgi:Tfp pilus assembly protein PilX